jgi:hypothetical protein
MNVGVGGVPGTYVASPGRLFIDVQVGRIGRGELHEEIGDP